MQPTQVNRLLILLAGLGAAYCLIHGRTIGAAQDRIRFWPTTLATVLSFEPGIDPSWGGQWYANPKVRFKYIIDGVEFEGRRLNPSPFNYQDRFLYSAETSHLASGAIVDCWYNPNEPSEAYVVNVGRTRAPAILTTCGIACLIVCILSLMRGRAKRGSVVAAA